MIRWEVITKIMSGRGVLFHALRAREECLSDAQLLLMIAGADMRMTPHIAELLHSNLEITLQSTSTHYVFLYSGREGRFIMASKLEGGRWVPSQIIQPQRKAG